VTANGWFQIFLVIAVVFVITKPLGIFMVRVFNREKTFLDHVLRPVEKLAYRLSGVDENHEMRWTEYAVSKMLFSAVSMVLLYLIQRTQHWLPLNPLKLANVPQALAFNTAASFTTNTNWQNYSGEVVMSYLTQMAGLAYHNFTSAAAGIALAMAVIRGISRKETDKLGNFWVDLTRCCLWVLLPVCLVGSLVLVSQGVVQNLKPYTTATLTEPQTVQVTGADGKTTTQVVREQLIAQGPVASQEVIKELGTNGGGFFGANGAHPYENPTALTNFVTCLGMMLFPMALVLMYGRLLGRPRHGFVIYTVMGILLVGMIGWAIHWDARQPNPGITAHAANDTFAVPSATAEGGKRAVPFPAIAGLPVDQALGNLEGAELRFGTSAGATFAAVTTAFTTGAVNRAHDSLNPMAGLSPFVGLWLNCVFGGKGVGMINFLMFLIIGVFIAGQMVGRTPEYLGRKVGAREMKLAMIALLIHPIMTLGPAGLFAGTAWGTKAESNPAAHGFSEIVYEFSSSSANNGSGFEGLGDTYGFNDNPTPAPTSVPWDIATGLVMLIGRYLPIIATIAMAASLGAKKAAPMGLGTLRDDTVTFGALLFGTIVIIGALLFLPVAALGPLAEHLGPIPFGG